MDQQKQNLVEQVAGFVNTSSLSNEDKKLLSEKISFAPVALLKMLATMLKEDPASLELVIKNLKLKLEAGDDPDKIQKIIKQEEEELERVLREEGIG